VPHSQLEELRYALIPELDEEEEEEGEDVSEEQRQQRQQQRQQQRTQLPPLRVRPCDSVSGVGLAQLWTGRWGKGGERDV
jgi:CO dehydrogenase/acetyl-CoA synthase beta subunit